MGEPGLTVLVVTHGGGPRLARCLAALAAQEPRADEVIVVVSRAGAVPVPAGPRVLADGRARHFGAAVNLGARAAHGGLLLVLNDDTVPRPGFLAALVAASTPHALLQPRILLLLPRDHLDNAGHGLFPDGHNLPRGRGRPDGARWDRPGSVGAVSGAAFLAPREPFLALGGFDEDLGPFGEDLDLSLRWVRAGGDLRYVPTACVEHELGASYGRASRRKVFLVERNRLRAAARSLPVLALCASPATTPLRWGLMALASAAGRGAVAPIPRAGALLALAGFAAGCVGVPGALRKRRGDARTWRRGECAMLRHLGENLAPLVDFFFEFSLPPARGSE
jgi:GT2 family glycosyltransferase